MSDREFFNLGSLYYDDETRLFSYSIWQDNKIINFTLSADMQMDGFAFILDYQQALAKAKAESKLRWWRRSSGAIEQDYTLDMMFIPIGRAADIVLSWFGKTIMIPCKIGNKLDYVFGKATGSVHNIERSTGMLKQLQSIGIFDNAAGRSLLQAHLESVYNGTKGVLQSNGRYLRESLLMGPNGALKIESVWEGDKLKTIKLLGGK